MTFAVRDRSGRPIDHGLRCVEAGERIAVHQVSNGHHVKLQLAFQLALKNPIWPEIVCCPLEIAETAGILMSSRPVLPPGLSFGEQVKWHIRHGTRPPGSSSQGEPWGIKKLAEKMRRSDRTLRNWCSNARLPLNTIELEREFFGQNKAHYDRERVELREAHGRQQDGSDDAPEAGTSVVALSNVPVRVPTHFMGREEALANIASALDRHQGRVAITAVHGLRGVGKTTLAAAFAELHRGDYRATWWIRAQNPESMRSDLISLGIRLGWVRPERGHEQELASIMERLRTDSEGLLLIYDNAIDATTLKPFLPTGGAAKILVTANTHVWRGLAEPIELGLWPKRIGADYLIARTGRRNERQAAETLSEFLGGLPLAHEQASAYCERLAVSMKDYTTRFTAEPYRLLDDAKHAPSEYNDGLTVARTFGLAIMEVAKLHAAALPLLTCLAQLPAHPIPLFLFSEGRVALEQPTLPFIDAEQLDHAVAALRSFALVEYESIPFVIWKDDEDIEEENPIAVVRLHRLVREVVLSRSERAVSEEARIPLMKAALKLYPYGREKFYFSGPHRNSDFLRYLIPSLVAEPIPNGQEGVAAQLIVKLVDNGDCSDPVPQLRRALSFAEAHFGPHHDQTAEILHYLAKQLITRQRPTKSRQETLRVIAEPLRLAQRALAIREQSDGFGNVLVPHSLELLDTMYTIMGRRDLAKECRDRAMKLLSGGVYF